jgi:hypothetical protein
MRFPSSSATYTVCKQCGRLIPEGMPHLCEITLYPSQSIYVYPVPEKTDRELLLAILDELREIRKKLEHS